jgi:hypothetical protein
VAVAAFTDLFNEGLDDLAAKLATISNMQVVTDPRNLRPPCLFVDAPSFEAINTNIAKMTFPVRCIGLGPNNLDAQRTVLNLAARVMTSGVGVTDGRPTVAIIGGVELPAYDLNINIQVQAG